MLSHMALTRVVAGACRVHHQDELSETNGCWKWILHTHITCTAGLDVSVHMKIHLVQSEEIKFETNGLHLSR